ncbi:MAG: hypothetical protein AAF656_08170 [Planctomycetota bacterium]
MFKAIGKFFRAIGYLFTGKVDEKRRELSKNPHVIQATYDRIVSEKKARIQQYKDAVARMITQEEKKLAKVRSLTDEVNHLEKLKEGAAAKARMTVQQLKAQGMSMEQIKSNDDYMRCLAAFNDFTSTLSEKREHIAELEMDVREISGNVKNHKVQLQQLLREIDKIKEEAAATVADVITSKEEEEIADMLSGISDDRTSKELEEMRDLREQSKAQARVSREMAGTDTAAQEREFLEYARTGVSSDEFDQLIGLADEADTAVATPRQNEIDAKLPE